MGKRKGKRKRERILQPTGPGGDFGPKGASASGRARFRPTWPSRARRRRGNDAVARTRTPERGGGADGVNGTEGGAGARPGPVGGEPRGGSPTSVRFCGGEAVAEHGRLMGVTGVGRISPAGAYGGRSAARWRVPAAVLPPVRFPATIEWGKWRVVNVRVWRSSWHNLIERKIAREGEGSSPER
jgi:hypothetical protein